MYSALIVRYKRKFYRFSILYLHFAILNVISNCGDTAEPKSSNLKCFQKKANINVKEKILGSIEENSRRFCHYGFRYQIPNAMTTDQKRKLHRFRRFIYGHIQRIEHSAFRISESKMRYHPPSYHIHYHVMIIIIIPISTNLIVLIFRSFAIIYRARILHSPNRQ